MHETPKAAQAFHAYCLLEDRSLAKLAVSWKLPDGKPAANLRQLEAWSAQHGWQARLIAREKEDAERERKKRLKEVQKMDEEHALLGRTQALRAVKQIEEMLKDGRFSPADALRLFKLGTELERVARGSSTQQIAFTGKDGESLAGAFQVHVFMPSDDEEEERE